MKAAVIFIMTAVAAAAPPDAAKFSKVEGQRADGILDQFDAARHQGGTFSADVVETKQLRILKQPVVSRGHVDFAPPARFRFELREPTRSVTVCDGVELWMHYPDFGETEHYPVGGTGRSSARQAIAPILAALGAQAAEWRKHYAVTVSEAPDWYLFELRPNQAPLREQMASIRLWVSANGFVLERFELMTIGGDRTVSEFTNAIVGRPIPEETFRWKGAAQKR